MTEAHLPECFSSAVAAVETFHVTKNGARIVSGNHWELCDTGFDSTRFIRCQNDIDWVLYRTKRARRFINSMI
jgi:hypothetical protein